MSRSPVSVIVTASGSTDDFRACLESLRPTLGLRDEVVCVFPAHRTDLRDTVRGHTWLTVLDDDSGDQATRWSTGCAATRHPVVVLLDGDVVVSAHWLDPVLEALADPAVVAAGPRCGLSAGPQFAELPIDATASVPAFQAHARRWRQEHTGRFTDVDRLGPVCVAIRREALERAGGPNADLPYDRLGAQGRLVVAHGALVAHVGTEQCSLRPPDIPDDAPLLSACMIVKDEEDVLGDCLTALRDFVDEIVVYDTGSTDRTRDIAREHGVRVIEGYWNDHFGDARNRSLAHCTGRWIIWVDADEVLTGDAAQARAVLSTASAVPGFLIGVISLTGHGTSMYGRQLSPRILRRDRTTFSGRIHEQPVHSVNGNPLVGAELPGLDIIHSGYTVTRTLLKNKGERNVRLSQLAIEDQKDSSWSMVNLARSQLLAGQADATIETCQKGLDNGLPQHRKHLLRTMIEAYMTTGRLAEAREALARFREVGGSAGSADEMEARLCVLEGDFAQALDIARAIPEDTLDDMFVAVDKNRTMEIEIVALSGLERHHEAAELMRGYVRNGRLPLPLPKMAEILTADGSGITELATLFSRSALRGLLLAASDDVPADLADELFEALWREHAAPMILASAARLGQWLPILRAMEWSARLRQHGFPAHCTLLALAGSPARSPRDRVLAAAIAAELFSDQRAMPLLEQALGAVPDDENGPVLDDLRRLAPTIAAAIEPAQAA